MKDTHEERKRRWESKSNEMNSEWKRLAEMSPEEYLAEFKGRFLIGCQLSILIDYQLSALICYQLSALIGFNQSPHFKISCLQFINR